MSSLFDKMKMNELRQLLRDKKMPDEAYAILRAEQPEIAPAQLRAWVDKFYRLWCRNQWKRERYAPSFHVDDKNLDPKTWCRFRWFLCPQRT